MASYGLAYVLDGWVDGWVAGLMDGYISGWVSRWVGMVDEGRFGCVLGLQQLVIPSAQESCNPTGKAR